MVVKYPSGGRGTCMSCFTDVPRVLCQVQGSVIPHIMPQVVLYMGLSVLAQLWNPLIDIRDSTVDGLWSCLVAETCFIRGFATASNSSCVL